MIVDVIREIFGWDRLFAIAFLQRTIFVCGLLLLWHLLRWWSLPAILLATTGTVVAMANFILTEGLTVPLSLLYAVLIADLALRAGSHSKTRFVALVTLAAATLIFMATIKLQFAAFLPLFVAAIMIPSNRQRMSRQGLMVSLGVPVVLIGILTLVQCLENRSELGVFEPVSEKARADWYGAWQVVFTVRGADSSDPALLPFFDDGDLFAFLHPLEEVEPDYQIRRRIIEDRIAAMFRAAGTTEASERWSAFLGALLGGRMDDLKGLVDRALVISPSSLENAYTSNTLGRAEGGKAVLEALNDGEATAILTSSTLAPALTAPLSDHRPAQPLYWIAALAICVLGALFSPRLRWVAGSLVTGVVAIALALGWSYIDNARYLVPAGLIAITIATLMVATRPWLDSTLDRQEVDN
jgi:hypothetical protein